MVALLPRFDHYVRCSLFNIMFRPEPVRAICWTSNYGCGDKDGPQFIGCVDRCEPEVHKVWILGEHGVTHEVHLTARFDVVTGIVGDFATNFLTENRHRNSMFVRKSINGSSEFLGAPAPLRTNGPPWIENVLISSLVWGVGVTGKISNRRSQPGGPYGSVSVMWSGPIQYISCVRRGPKNVRAVARRVCDDIL